MTRLGLLRRLCLALFLIWPICWAPATAAAPVQWSVTNGGNGHFYDVVYVPGGITWSEANARVQVMGGGWHLATVTSQAENAFIFSQFGSDPRFSVCCRGNNSTGPWLGAFATANVTNDWT